MENKGAYLVACKEAFSIGKAPLPTPEPNEVLIRNHAVSINPIDIVNQDYGILVPKYPWILGMEAAGEIVDIGTEVTKFKKGVRVAALGLWPRTHNSAHAAFQLYMSSNTLITVRIPDHLSYAQAAVFPLALATATAGLLEPQYLNLPAPALTGSAKQSLDEHKRAILIWGGSSAVGSCAIQVANAIGLIVLTTASTKNHSYVKELGAAYAFDYTVPEIVTEILNCVSRDQLKIVGVYDVFSQGTSSAQCKTFLRALGLKLFATTRPDENRKEDVTDEDGIRRVTVHPPGRDPTGEIPTWIGVWTHILEEKLNDGSFKAKPEPLVVKGGIEKVQEGLDLYRKGVSAAKVVVEIE